MVNEYKGTKIRSGIRRPSRSISAERNPAVVAPAIPFNPTAKPAAAIDPVAC